jgi:hypothetical protein
MDENSVDDSPHKNKRPIPSVRGKTVEIDSLDAALTRFYKQIYSLPSEQQEKALQFHAVYLAYLVRLYRRKELPMGRYTPN